MFLLLCCLAPLGSFVDLHWILKGSRNRTFCKNQYEISKNGVQEGVLKKQDVCFILDNQLGGFEMQNQAFRLIIVAKYEVSVFHEKASKMRG